MSEGNHTPGPWQVGDEGPGTMTIEATDGLRNCVLAEITADIDFDDEDHANALLIAAAPDLLEACEDLTRRDFWTTHEDDCDCAACEAYRRFIGSAKVVKLVTAIRKAKGL